MYGAISLIFLSLLTVVTLKYVLLIMRADNYGEGGIMALVALIERSELVRDWLELAARCECPDLDQCPLFDEVELPPAGGPRPPRAGLSAGRCRALPGAAGRFWAAPFVQG